METGCVSDARMLTSLKGKNVTNVQKKNQIRLYISTRTLTATKTIVSITLPPTTLPKSSSNREIGIANHAIFSTLLIGIHAKIVKSLNND